MNNWIPYKFEGESKYQFHLPQVTSFLFKVAWDCFRECSNWRRVEKGRATLRIGSDKDQFEVCLPCSL